ncbi:UNVERIFIED_CONTAM: cytochrome and DOMON domain-containing protein [Sesamum latifolium]|uniref:Cytochrome and DOMON domain-containing protein n=1 Tax=Sesamum latifolium TaxID=2727402 RepID=A0AAW2Y3T4_9LAMI
MASSSQLMATFLLLTAISLFSPSQSATCTSQTFTGNRLYTFCNDLPSLNSYLHWAYDSAQSTLSIAFVAAPPRPDGWVSWAINPTATTMVGSQALIAFRDSRGGMTVKTYNVSSYGPLRESKVWYEVKESSADFSGGLSGFLQP